MILHRPEAYDPENRPGEADLIVAKNRHGPIGTVELVWLKEMLRFGDKAVGWMRAARSSRACSVASPSPDSSGSSGSRLSTGLDQHG
ncbi:DnaB-like helicase C-terminal domain-containing protein [Planctomicrobium sp. SH664]|uniref:DnaB-like helicase C-terminal domain-containing protein n=1 Tax=Planctomicrobium sp. SH664 TaxID=3448125 RepID=UPI003F5B4F36